MKIILEDNEAVYLGSMIGTIASALEGHREMRRDMEKLKKKIMPPRAYAKINKNDLSNLKDFVKAGLNSCEKILTEESPEEDKKHVVVVKELLTNIQTKLGSVA